MSKLRERVKDDVFLRIAQAIGTLSTCDRGAVGAVITMNGRAISWGFNGAPEGLPHCDENGHGWDHLPNYRYILPEDMPGCRNATHAEANAIAFAARQGISTDGGTLYVECSPCDTCARLLVAAGLRRVVFARAYRDSSGVELLEKAGVEITCLS